MLWAQHERITVVILQHLIELCTRWCLQGPEQNALGNLLVLCLLGGIFCGAILDWVWLIGKGWWSDDVAQALPILGVWCVVAIKRLAAFGSSCAEGFNSNRTDCISQDFRFSLQLFLGQEGVGTRTNGKGKGTLGLDWIVQFCEHIILCTNLYIFFLQFCRAKVANVPQMQREAWNWIHRLSFDGKDILPDWRAVLLKLYGKKKTP